MNFKIVFDNSGDELLFNAIYPELVESYIHELDARGINNFALDSKHDVTIDDRIEALQGTIMDINEFIHLFLSRNIEERSKLGILDQAHLNKLHADWANSHEVTFNIDEMRTHLSKEVREEFDRIHELFPDDIRDVTLATILARTGRLETYEALNSGIHYLEASFHKIMYNAIIPPEDYYVKINNPFGEEVLSNDICNLRLSYYVKGRTLYDKFVNFDTNLEYDDLNNHDIQSTRLELDLAQPQTIPLSKEYVAWCNSHGMTPTGDFVNLGNLVDIEKNITEYRQIVYKNLQQKNNYRLELGE